MTNIFEYSNILVTNIYSDILINLSFVNILGHSLVCKVGDDVDGFNPLIAGGWAGYFYVIGHGSSVVEAAER